MKAEGVGGSVKLTVLKDVHLCTVHSAVVHNQMHLLAVFSIRECKHLTRLKTAIILKAIWQKNSLGRGEKHCWTNLGERGKIILMILKNVM